MIDDSNEMADAPPMRTRPHYIPLSDAREGMTLGATATVVKSGILRLSLPTGHILNEDSLHQLKAHQAEFIFILEPDRRSDQQVALDASQAAGRLLQIFSGADLTEPNIAGLFDQILAYRSA